MNKKTSISVALVLSTILTANPAAACDPRELAIAFAITSTITGIFVVTLAVSLADGQYKKEQFCPADSPVSYCCDATSIPYSNLTDCEYQVASYGSCGEGKVLYCEGQDLPAKVRNKDWVEPLIAWSATMVGLAGFASGISGLAWAGSCYYYSQA